MDLAPRLWACETINHNPRVRGSSPCAATICLRRKTREDATRHLAGTVNTVFGNPLPRRSAKMGS
jgi:hypothetical protein